MAPGDFREALNASTSLLRATKRRMLDVAARAAERGLASIGVPPPDALLVLGHMRSGSTLLLHLLLTNPEIAGIGERNAPYRSEADLARLAVTTRWSRRAPFARFRYVADQINHTRFTPNPHLLGHARVRVLFLLRRPEASLASLLDLTRTHYQAWSSERAVQYYSERLDDLASHGALIASRERAAFLSYEQLILRPTEVLGRLREFLGTRAGFSERYDVQDFTGKRGDPSDNIRSGKIRAPSPIAAVEIPAAELARAAAAHARCCERLAGLALLPPDRQTGT